MFVYSVPLMQNYLRVIDGFNDHDVKFCMSVAEIYLNDLKDPMKRMYYLGARTGRI